MELLSNPFLIHYNRSFKDQNYIYFMMEYVRGKELFEVIREIGLLNSFET